VKNKSSNPRYDSMNELEIDRYNTESKEKYNEIKRIKKLVKINQSFKDI